MLSMRIKLFNSVNNSECMKQHCTSPLMFARVSERLHSSACSRVLFFCYNSMIRHLPDWISIIKTLFSSSGVFAFGDLHRLSQHDEMITNTDNTQRSTKHDISIVSALKLCLSQGLKVSLTRCYSLRMNILSYLLGFMWHALLQYRNSSQKNENVLKMHSLSVHQRSGWVCFFIRFVEMCLCISVSAMDALQWMGAVRMRVCKNITIIHTTPVHQLTSGEDKSWNKSSIKMFLTQIS